MPTVLSVFRLTDPTVLLKEVQNFKPGDGETQ